MTAVNPTHPIRVACLLFAFDMSTSTSQSTNHAWPRRRLRTSSRKHLGFTSKSDERAHDLHRLFWRSGGSGQPHDVAGPPFPSRSRVQTLVLLRLTTAVYDEARGISRVGTPHGSTLVHAGLEILVTNVSRRSGHPRSRKSERSDCDDRMQQYNERKENLDVTGRREHRRGDLPKSRNEPWHSRKPGDTIRCAR